MQPLLIVKMKVGSQARHGLGNALIGLEVNLLILDRPPQALDENGIQRAASPIHADDDVRFLKTPREGVAGQLAALIGVENLGLASTQRSIQCLQAEIDFQADRNRPGEYIATEPVDDRHQLDKALSHPYIGDVATPDLIHLINLDIA